jgi:hypothetical protein
MVVAAIITLIFFLRRSQINFRASSRVEEPLLKEGASAGSTKSASNALLLISILLGVVGAALIAVPLGIAYSAPVGIGELTRGQEIELTRSKLMSVPTLDGTGIHFLVEVNDPKSGVPLVLEVLPPPVSTERSSSSNPGLPVAGEHLLNGKGDAIVFFFCFRFLIFDYW